MKIKYLLFAMLFCLLLNGCQLADPEGETGQEGDEMIGVFVTTDSLDLFDAERYFEDNYTQIINNKEIEVSGEDAARYSGRLYAVEEPNPDDPDGIPNYVFPGVEGIPFYYLYVEREGKGPLWTQSPSEGIEDREAWFGTYPDRDDVEMEGTVYVSTGAGNYMLVANPMYRTADGKVYTVGGQGISSEVSTAGVGMSTFLEETNTVTVNGKTQERKFKTTIKVKVVDPAEEYILLQMDSNNRVVMNQTILPGQAPERLSPIPETAYLILEAHCRNPVTGETSVERTLYDWEEEQFSTFYPLDNGYFGKQNTELLWQ